MGLFGNDRQDGTEQSKPNMKRAALKGMTEKQLLKMLVILQWDVKEEISNAELVQIAKEA